MPRDSYNKWSFQINMNLKERGVTVGDLLIFLVIISSTIFIIKKINNDKQSSFNFSQQEIIYLAKWFFI